MKKLLLFLLIAPVLGFGQDKFKTDLGTFDYSNGVRYRAVFNSDLDIESQVIKINADVAFIGYPMRSASMKVEKKDGKTRITVTDFSMGEVSSSGGVMVGNTFIGGDDTEYYKIDNVTWNEKKQSFKRSFVNNYSKKLEKSIMNAVNRLVEANSSEDDDW